MKMEMENGKRIRILSCDTPTVWARLWTVFISFLICHRIILRNQLSFGSFPFAVITILYLHLKSSPQLDALQ